MQRRLVLVLVTLSLLATVLVVASVTRVPSAVPLSSSPGDASHVTMYENGLAAVSLTRSFNATGGESTLSFPLPPTAIYDSVTLAGDDVAVRTIRAALAQTSGAQPGDEVTVHVGDQSYHGIVQSIDGGKVALTTASGVAYVDLAKASAIEVLSPSGQPASAPGSVAATALVRTTQPGAHVVTLSYLVQGPGWTPSFRLDADTGQLKCFATLTASDDWHAITLDLVSGQPHVVYTPSPHPEMRLTAFAGEAASAPGAPAFDASFAPSAPLGDMHRYHYDGAIDLARGESARLVLAQGNVDVMRTFVEAHASTGGYGAIGDRQDVTVLDRLELRNTLPEPLPAGTLRAYRGGEWVGEDALPPTPVGETANVTLSTAQDVKATLTLVGHAASPSSDTWTYALDVKNALSGAGAHALDLRAIVDYPSYRTTLHESDPPGATLTGSSATWDASVPLGGASRFTVTYETQKYG